MVTENRHNEYMKHCIALAEKALQNGNPPVGSILVYQDNIIGEGIENGRSSKDITNHAEILAIRDAVQRDNEALISSATMYSTHEPCIMCSYVIRHHKVSELVYGMEVDYVGGHSSELKVLDTQKVPKWGAKPKIKNGVLKHQCQELSKRYEDSVK